MKAQSRAQYAITQGNKYQGETAINEQSLAFMGIAARKQV
jgi:hypothetical protein